MSKTINFTKAKIDQLPIPQIKQRAYYKDTQINGLSLAMLCSGAKSFYVVKKINGSAERIFLGKYPDLSIENARKRAVVILGKIALGINPNEEKRQIRVELTFGQLFDQYMTRYSKPHKKTWRNDERDVTRLCGHWFKKRLSDFKRSDIQHLHETVFAENGLYMANDILRRVRAIFNKAIDWGWNGSNPTRGIKKYREQSRDRFVQPHEMPHLLRSINEESETIRDLLWIMLLTGARVTNARLMRREQLGLDRAEWRIPTTKNGDPLIIPLPDRAVKILLLRLEDANSPFVFPHKNDKEKPVNGLKTHWVKVRQRASQYVAEANSNNTLIGSDSLNALRMHDLRRTFGSYQAISGASLQVIGKSLGHKCTQATQIYARLNMDAVRDSVTKATDTMLALQ